MAYGYRARTSRSGTRVSKRRLMRKAGMRKRMRVSRGKRVVTRRVLSRALAPLKPELKHIDVVNTTTTYIETAPVAIDQYSFYNSPGTLQDGSYDLAKTSLSSPILLSYIAQGSNSTSRVGRSVSIKGIDIHMTVRCGSSSTASEPFFVRVFVFKSKAMGQYTPGYTLPIGNGNLYPHFAPMASASGPIWWYLQSADIDSFPSWEHTMGGKKDMCQLVQARRFKMNPMVVDNTAAGTPYMAPMDGVYEKYLNMRINCTRGGKTTFNDDDASRCAGFCVNNHYWLVAFREPSPGSATAFCQMVNGDLRWRLRYTDA